MLVMLSGPSGVGKSRCIRLAVQAFGCSTETPVTTRPRRADETPGIEYEFISVEEFQSLISSGQLCAWDFALGAYYGYRRSLIDRTNAGEDIIVQIMARMALRLREQISETALVFLDSTSDSL